MIKFLFAAGLLFTIGCTSAPLMQEPFFNSVSKGSNIADIESIYGMPYEVRALPNGTQEYCYIQRIELGRSSMELLEFVFEVNQGKVVNKQCRHNGTSNFQFGQ